MTTNSNITKSDVHKAKEQELANLQAKLKKINTQLKRNRTMLSNLKVDIQQTHQKMGTGVVANMQDIADLQKEVSKLGEQVQKSHKIKRKLRKEIAEILDMMGVNDPDNSIFGDLQTQMEVEPPEDKQGEGFSSFLDNFQITPPEEEQRDIRKIFLKLATRFHPDKAEDEAQAEQLHKLMQRINDAYQRNDVYELLEIDSEFGDAKDLSKMDGKQLLDHLEQEIKSISSEIVFKEKQLERIKLELKNIRNSELGYLAATNKQAKRHGMSSIEDAGEALTVLRKALSFVKESLEYLLANNRLPTDFDTKMQAFAEEIESFSLEDDEDDFISDEEELIQAFLEELMKNQSSGKNANQNKRGKTWRKM